MNNVGKISTMFPDVPVAPNVHRCIDTNASTTVRAEERNRDDDVPDGISRNDLTATWRPRGKRPTHKRSARRAAPCLRLAEAANDPSTTNQRRPAQPLNVREHPATVVAAAATIGEVLAAKQPVLRSRMTRQQSAESC